MKYLISVFLLFLLVPLFLSCGTEADKDADSAGQLYTCGMHPQVIQEDPGNCPICEMKLTPMKTGVPVVSEQVKEHGEEAHHQSADVVENTDKKIKYWRAPMDPSYISETPGKSPMGMDLIPVYEGEEAESGAAISIDPVTVQNMGVRTAIVNRQPFGRVIRTVGHIDYNEETIWLVNLKFDGWIEKLFINKTGEFVKKGQPLFSIYSPQLVTTQEEYLLAYQNHLKLSKSPFREIASGAHKLLQATHKRLQYWDISDAQIEKLQQEGQVRKNLTVYAPASGVVEHKTAVEGGYVRAGADLFRIAGLDQVWVLAHVFDYELPWIKVGQQVEMSLTYFPGKQFSGKVDYIYPYLDAKARDVKLRIVLDNAGYELKPQMYANVRIKASVAEPQLVIPSEAVIRSGTRNVVFIAIGDGKFQPQDVILGPEGEGGMILVRTGLTGGERIVTSAQFLLDSESRLREAIQKMLESRSNTQ